MGKKNGKGVPKGTPRPKGAGGRPVGNHNALKHGAFSPRLLPDEQPAYEHFLEEYLRDVHNPSVTDRRAVERLAVLEAKWYMAVMKNAPGDALETLQRLLHRELKVLQVTRESKESQHGSGNTPAEIMATLLLQVAGLADLDGVGVEELVDDLDGECANVERLAEEFQQKLQIGPVRPDRPWGAINTLVVPVKTFSGQPRLKFGHSRVERRWGFRVNGGDPLVAGLCG